MRTFTLILIAGLAGFGCQQSQTGEQQKTAQAEGAAAIPVVDPGADDPAKVTVAKAILQPTEGNDTKGEITLRQTSDGLQVTGRITGLKPGSTHGWHVHVYGDCTGPAAKTAGTHFNFDGSSLNPPKDIDRITGNFGELTANEKGAAEVDVTVKDASLVGPYSIIGRAVIVHERGNDPSKPPIGDAGGRMACGVVGLAEQG